VQWKIFGFLEECQVVMKALFGFHRLWVYGL